MHVNDSEAALDARRFLLIEAEFLRLVQRPERDSSQGRRGSRMLGRLFDRVRAALKADKQKMPEDLAASRRR